MNKLKQFFVWLIFMGIGLQTNPLWAQVEQGALPAADPAHPWWLWPTVLLFSCFILGIVAVLAEVGGGVLICSAGQWFFRFHLDFVRGTGLLVALAGALATGPECCTLQPLLCFSNHL